MTKECPACVRGVEAYETRVNEFSLLCKKHAEELNGKIVAIVSEKERRMNEFDMLAKDMIERKYQLRIEHNHGDMKWYAYYAQRGERKLFESDPYSSGENDWKTGSNTPTEALQKLKAIIESTRSNGQKCTKSCRPNSHYHTQACMDTWERGVI